MKRITKIIGTISNEIIEKYQLYEYKNIKIVQSLDLYVHISKHVLEFTSIDSYNKTINNIENIINDPDFVYYNKKRNSLQYYKKLDENICIVIKLILRKNKNCYIATIYPVSEQKINKIIEQSYIEGK